MMRFRSKRPFTDKKGEAISLAVALSVAVAPGLYQSLQRLDEAISDQEEREDSQEQEDSPKQESQELEDFEDLLLDCWAFQVER
ncbi:hypothetical protein FJT64_003148 [Amphibalanus amphitrite]|uniref:Uncharacterized protein n=1 Tax=Amphibalanus amphitrite TaxID=1232801 RepID=A0A6A4WCK4_AMPAM|nr:hypothetical protein FJT64_003148 [Amphibalanus amphitrite]